MQIAVRSTGGAGASYEYDVEGYTPEVVQDIARRLTDEVIRLVTAENELAVANSAEYEDEDD